MNASALIEQSAGALPAPVWFVQVFKVLGFVLHMVPMNLWFAGLTIAVWLYVRGSANGRRFGARLIGQMPIIVALGINLGIVPLLFLQVGYHQVFYPATILTAWLWLGVIALLIPAYYGVYLTAFSVQDCRPLTGWRLAVGKASAHLFILIGLIFSSAMTLMAHTGRWPSMWLAHSVGGAATGMAWNLGDPTAWTRWLLMFGLALGTTGAWALVDAIWLADGEEPGYRTWIQRFATRLFLASTLVVLLASALNLAAHGLVGTLDVFRPWPMELLTFAALTAPAVPLVWLRVRNDRELGRLEVSLLGASQLGVLTVNAILRQLVQNAELRPTFDIAAQPTAPQWGPLIVFLVLFAAGVVLIGWMLAQVAKARQGTPAKHG